MREGGSGQIGIRVMFDILNQAAEAPSSHSDVFFFIVPQSYFLSDISAVMKVSFKDTVPRIKSVSKACSPTFTLVK